MFSKRQASLNSITSVIQTLASGVILFVLYGFLIDTLGPVRFGIWSIVLATTSVAQIIDFGFSSGVVRYVSLFMARGDNLSAVRAIRTATTFVCISVGLFGLAFYPAARWLLRYLAPSEQGGGEALSILPVALVSTWVNIQASIFLSGLEAMQRFDKKNLLLVLSSVQYLLLCIWLTNASGLMGVAFAQLIQAITIAVAGWLMVRRDLGAKPIFPFSRDRSFSGELVAYGTKMQVVSIVKVLYDPITKALLSRFGGLDSVGYFEMANKLVLQVRSIVVSAFRTAIPMFSEFTVAATERLNTFYLKLEELTAFIVLPLFSFLLAAAPIVSEVWIGHYEESFVFFLSVLCVGWLLNTLTMPAYYGNLGTGNLNWNMYSHLIIGALNLFLGIGAGVLYGSKGVVSAWVLALAMGSVMIIVEYRKRQKLGAAKAALGRLKAILTATLLLPLLILLMYYCLRVRFGLLGVAGIGFVTFVVVLLAVSWRHPMKYQLIELLSAIVPMGEAKGR